MIGYLTSPSVVQLVPWLRRQGIHVPPAFYTDEKHINLWMIRQYAQNVSESEWTLIAAHISAVCKQHGWEVTDACPAAVVDVPVEPAIEATEVIEVPDAEEPESKTPKRRRRVVKVKKVKK